MMKDDIANKYTYRVEWSEEDGVHIARCLEFSSLSAHGKSPEAALSELKSVVSHSIEWLKEAGESVPAPYGQTRYKGNLTLRIPPSVHRSLVIRSAEEGVSLNQYILSLIK
jgi:predicted HicB family RNase H-like nuclease